MKKNKISDRVQVLKKLILKDADGQLDPDDIESIEDCEYVEDIVSWLDCVGFGNYVECYEYLLDLMMAEFIDK